MYGGFKEIPNHHLHVFCILKSSWELLTNRNSWKKTTHYTKLSWIPLAFWYPNVKLQNDIIHIGMVNQPTQNFSSKPPTLPHLLTVPPDFLQEFAKYTACVSKFSFGKTLLKAKWTNKSRKEKLKFSQRKHLPIGWIDQGRAIKRVQKLPKKSKWKRRSRLLTLPLLPT